MQHSISLNSLLFLAFTLTGIATMSAQNGPQFGITVFPNYSGGRIAAGSTVNEAAIDSIELRETSRPSLSWGVAAQWRAEKIGFRTGFQITDTGYRSVKEGIPTNVEAPDGALTRRVDYRNLNIELPAEILFLHELNDRHRVNFMMGMSAAYNLNNYEDNIFFSGEKIGRARNKISNNDFQRLQLGFQTGIGWQYDMGERMIFFAQPTFYFWYTGLLAEAEDVNRSLYAIGLKTGILFKTKTNQ